MDRNPEVSSFLEEEERLAKFGRKDKDGQTPNAEKEEEVIGPVSSDSDSDDYELIQNFSEKRGKDILFNQLNYTKIILDLELQKELCLEVGVNISDEFPWKLMKKEILEDYLTDNHPETEILRNKLNQLDNDSVILVGYLSDFAEEGTFIVYDDAESARTASRVVEQLEALQRHKLKRRLTKIPRKWECLGSDKEVNEYAPRKRDNIVNVQIQSTYPVRLGREMKLEQRFCDDARDGYVELVAGKKVFDNIYKSRIDSFIQCAPMRVNLEQQTDPTFPTNAWSQYIYVIERERREKLEAELKAKAAEEAAAGGEVEEEETEEGEQTTPEIKTVVLSRQIEEFLAALEFNQVDMYRNDYILARSKRLSPFQVPHLAEKFCFADISKTSGRRVQCIEWHPTVSGVFVASYAFDTPSVKIPTSDTTDLINRIVLQPNYVLMWAFDDTLSPKLQLEAPREVCVLSFCPFDPTILVGGLVNGQIIIWDLKDRLTDCDSEELLTPKQARNRELMKEFLRWTNTKNQYLFVRRATISALEYSQQGQITGIRWLNSHHMITTGGEIRENEKESNRIFVTASLDGTVAFWDLLHPEKCLDRRTPTKKKQLNLPASISEGMSEYAKYDRLFRPQNMISVKKPISAMIFNDAQFRMEPIGSTNRALTIKIPFRMIPLPPLKIEPRDEVDEEEIEEEFNPLNCFYISTSLGEIYEVKWKGHETDPQAVINRDQGNLTQSFAPIHDGPVVVLERNPFIPDVILSIGTRVLAIWRLDTPQTPIYYRRRPAALVSAKWSIRRAAVFFITRDDGDIEIWDLLNQTQSPTLVESIGSQIVTTIVQQKLPLMQDVVAIGDFNSNIRILVIPPPLATATPDEVNHLDRLIGSEIDRRRHLANLQAEWFAANEDIIAAKRQMELDAREAEERRQRLARDQEDAKRLREEKEARRRAMRDKKKITFDLPQQLNRKWDEMNLMRLMKMIMTMKKFNPDQVAQQIAPEKERLEYERTKKATIQQSFAKVDEELIAIRQRLMPVQETLVDRRTLIKDLLEEILKQEFDYAAFEKSTLMEIAEYKKNGSLKFNDILARGQKSREIINKSFGNTLHQDLYEEQKRFRQGYRKSTQDPASRVESSRASRRARSVTFPDDVKSDE
ncbi:dynein axonemal intermediate chain 3 [Lutzomyia longipalpis]|uniref:dynein axonemal intermediate chain 3 n=1 Tax=Lutzomyia longipalpis TaxID=7200 RepID=UPI002483692A|nr:dynein axonemal intermediate chain 3 [Lutzomyia longipalpis]